MVRKFIFGLIAALMIVLSACGGSKEKAENETKSSEEAVTEASKEVKTESSEPAKKAEEDNWLFPNADSLIEVPMGTCIDGKQTPFLTIKLPANAYVGGLYTDDEGKSQWINNDINTLSELVSQGMYGLEQVATNIDVNDNNSLFYITVYPYDEATYSDSYLSTFATKVSDNGDFSNWFTDTGTGLFYISVYKKEWVIQIKYSGDLREKYTDKEIAEAFNAIMTDL